MDKTMLRFQLLLVLFGVTNAASFSNGSSSTFSSIGGVTASSVTSGSSQSWNQFIDCSSYQAKHPAAFRTNTITAQASTSGVPQPFEEYWCKTWATEIVDPGVDSGFSRAEYYFQDLNDTTKEFCLSLQKANYSEWLTDPPPPVTYGPNDTTNYPWQPTVTPPCCDSYCKMTVGAAQVFYWPTPAPFMDGTTVVDQSGFTFTSPSVYVVYNDIAAVGQCGTIGPSHSRLTIPYAASEVMSIPYGNDGPHQPVNFADLYPNCTTRNANYTYPQLPCETSSLGPGGYPPSCGSAIDRQQSVMSLDQKHCYPYLQYPAGIHNLEPAWQSCNDQNRGGYIEFIFDPPRALKPVDAIAPSPTEAAPQAESTSASPASAPTPMAPSKTDPPDSSTPTRESKSSLQPIPSVDTQLPGSSAVIDPPDGIGSGGSSSPSAVPVLDPMFGHDSKSSTGQPASSRQPRGSGSPRIISPQPPESAAASDFEAEGQRHASPSSSDVSHAQANPSHVQAVHAPAKGDPSHAQADPSQAQANPSQAQANPSQAQANPSQSQVNPLQDPASPSQDQSDSSYAQAGPLSTTLDGHVIHAIPSNSIVSVDGQSVARGGSTIVVAGTSVALHSNGDLVLGTSTISNFHPATPRQQLPAFAVGGGSATVAFNLVPTGGSPSEFQSDGIIYQGASDISAPSGLTGSSSLSHGQVSKPTENAEVITVSGVPVSFVGGNVFFPSSTCHLASLTPGAIVTAAGQRLTVLPNHVVIDGTALTSGGAAMTIAGTPVSLGHGGLVVGTSTLPASMESSSSAVIIGGKTYTVSEAPGGVAVAGTILQANQPPSESQASSSPTGIAGAILSAFGNGPSANASAGNEDGGSDGNGTSTSVSSGESGGANGNATGTSPISPGFTGAGTVTLASSSNLLVCVIITAVLHSLHVL